MSQKIRVVKHWSHDCTHAYHFAAVIRENVVTVIQVFAVNFKVNMVVCYDNFLTAATLKHVNNPKNLRVSVRN